MARRKAKKTAYIPPAHEIENKREHKPRAQRAQRSSRGAGRRREPPPPSWRRVLKKLPLYFLLLFALQYSLSGNQYDDNGARAFAAAVQAAVVSVAFLPFMYYLERGQYRRWQTRMQRERSHKEDGP